jgi:hypothetical protein
LLIFYYWCHFELKQYLHDSSFFKHCCICLQIVLRQYFTPLQWLLQPTLHFHILFDLCTRSVLSTETRWTVHSQLVIEVNGMHAEYGTVLCAEQLHASRADKISSMSRKKRDLSRSKRQTISKHKIRHETFTLQNVGGGIYLYIYIQGEHKFFPCLQTFITIKLCEIQTFFFLM